MCSLKVTILPFELVVLFFQGFREILFLFLLLLFTLSCTMEELARQCNKFSLLEKQVIYVSGLYEHKLPFTRKAFDSARMESE